jgi:hypothetical protein
MLNKYFTSAAVVAGLLFTASVAHATATPFSCAVNNAQCQNAFKSMGNNSAVGAAADSVDWGQFATSLGIATNNGGIANNSSETTPQNDTVHVTSADQTAFTTYQEGLGSAQQGTPGGRNFQPGKAWDGQFANKTVALYTASNSITLSFGIPLIGLGIDAEVFNAGGYTETLQAYNSSGQLLQTATQTNAGTSSDVAQGKLGAEGSVSFVGITTNAQNNAASLASLGISYVTITTTCTAVGQTAACPTTGGFAIDTSLLYHYPISNPTGPSSNTPEPGTMSLLGAGLAGLGYFRRRRASKAA